MSDKHLFMATPPTEFMIKSVVETSSDNTAGTLMNEWGIFGVLQACRRSKAYNDDDYLDDLIDKYGSEEGFMVKKADFRYAIERYIEQYGSF